MTPKEVIQAQLKALQTNDTPEENHGIAVAWEYAHPKNRANTGPLSRFTAMLHSAAYEPLLDHRSHTITELKERDGQAAFEVNVVDEAGTRLNYLWVVERINRADPSSPWRTTSVSAPVESKGGDLT